MATFETDPKTAAGPECSDVCVLTGTQLRLHVHLVLCQLHWLPVQFQIKYVDRDNISAGPSLPICPQRALHSSNQHPLVIPQPKRDVFSLKQSESFLSSGTGLVEHSPKWDMGLAGSDQLHRTCKTEMLSQAYGWGGYNLSIMAASALLHSSMTASPTHPFAWHCSICGYTKSESLWIQ